MTRATRPEPALTARYRQRPDAAQHPEKVAAAERSLYEIYTALLSPLPFLVALGVEAPPEPQARPEADRVA